MKIQWLGHSSFRLTGSKTIITDPFGDIGITFPNVRADIVTVSHGHHDHNAVDLVKGEPAIVDDAGPHIVADISVMGYNTAHDDAKGAKRGNNIVFVIKMDGTKVVHLGDLGSMPDHSVLKAISSPDVLLIPIGGNYTIDAQMASEIIKAVQPKTTIPMHYKTQGLDVAVAGIDPFLDLMQDVQHVQGSELLLTPSMSRVIVFEKPAAQG